MFNFLKRRPESLLRTMEKKFAKCYGFNPNDLVKQEDGIYRFISIPSVSDMLENSFSINFRPASMKEEILYFSWQTIKEMLK